MSKIDLSVVIPSLAEHQNLKKLIPQIINILKNKISYEILIIDGVNRDIETYKIKKINKNIKYLNRKKNNDYGNAVRLGIKKSTGKFILFMDADFSHLPNFIPKLYNFKTYDIVIASRYIHGGNSDNNFFLKFLSRLLNFFYGIVLGLKLKDISNSFRLYNAAKIKKLKLTCNHFDIIEEIVFKFSVNYKKSFFKEIPYHFRERKYGKTKRNLFIIFAYLISIIKIRFQN